MPIDLHNHSLFSPDSDTPIEEIVKEATGKGLKVIGISDHDDLDTSFPLSYRLKDPESYLESLSTLKEKSNIKVLSGLEVGLQSCAKIPPDGDFDYFIYSVHGVPGVTDLSVENLWTLYLEEAIEAISEIERPGFFGHIDFLRRYIPGHRPLDNRILLDELLKRLIRVGIGIEINTSGWRYPYKEPSPQRWIVERYVSLGGRVITAGSDSHRKEDVGSYIHDAVSLLKEIGVKEIFYCERMEYVPIQLQEI
ncbi:MULTISPECIES: histidinol-phosphatase HisJ family protein [unclassified Mesotoga]|uniref:histidinol-phosphatase HisJ family protein n=1 Tax=unclassified Mesotoga TaxID=1184398 RepID=UPI002600EB83|nr:MULTISPECIES: histidinol-phosphatase HisJ family protein [unclassified Mesotoga]